MRHYNEREKEYIRDVIEKMKTANERELRMIWIFARTTVKGLTKKEESDKIIEKGRCNL